MNTLIEWIITLMVTIISYEVSPQEALTFNTLEETIVYNNNLEGARLYQEITQTKIAKVKGRALPQIRCAFSTLISANPIL